MATRPKPPAESKAELMAQAQHLLSSKFNGRPFAAMDYLLNYFTGLDLVGIIEDLRRE